MKNPSSYPAIETNAAYCRTKNCQVFYSAGNIQQNMTTPTPASAIVVGATDSNDFRSSFSSFGNGVDIWAPGTSIQTTSGRTLRFYVTANSSASNKQRIDQIIQYLDQNRASLVGKKIRQTVNGVVNQATIRYYNSCRLWSECEYQTATGTSGLFLFVVEGNSGTSWSNDVVNNPVTIEGHPSLNIDYQQAELRASTAINNGYVSISGTSFSSPNAAGLAALMISLKPDITCQQIEDILKSSADIIPITGPGGYSANVPRINSRKALEAVQALDGSSSSSSSSSIGPSSSSSSSFSSSSSRSSSSSVSSSSSRSSSSSTSSSSRATVS